MDKAILKKFAIESRQDLMQKMDNKIKSYYIDEEFTKSQIGDIVLLSNDKHSLSLSKEEYAKRQTLINRIKELGLEQVIEESAYTWFNRIIAIRYMEIHDYLPLTKNNQSLGIRVLSSKDNTPDPEILKFTNLTNPDLDIDFKKEKYAELKIDNDKFKYVLLLICKKLGKVIPQVFDGVTDYIDILIPDNLLNDTGFVNKIIKEVPEDNFNEVEIIGWLYQYYNQTEKDRVISAKKAYKKNEIPYATQLFTPDWIVKYMVENSLGRYYVEHNGEGGLYVSDDLYPSDNLFPSSPITENWKYFIKDNIKKENNRVSPTDITCIDPCCGSGHILVYMFEILYQIYENEGYNKTEIPELILKNNLYGLDIDDRAGQLSVLSVLLKAREYDKNIFNKDIVRNLNIMSIQESSNIDSLVKNVDLSEESKKLLDYLNSTFKDAKEIGSLLIVENNDYSPLIKELENDNTIFSLELRKKVMPLIKQSILLSCKYNVVVTNPPYLPSNLMELKLKKYIEKNFNISKADVFASFILRIFHLCVNGGYTSALSPYAWMFLKTYEKLRKYIIESKQIIGLVQLEYNSFEGACVPVCIFTIKNSFSEDKGVYIRLSDFPGIEIQEEKTIEAINNKKCKYRYYISQKEFKKIDGEPISYWTNMKILDIMNSPKLGEIGDAKSGMQTGNNNKFLRLWFEVNLDDIGFNIKNNEECKIINKKWIPQTKGGDYRKWYGNYEYVVNYLNQGYDIRNYEGTGIVKNESSYFKEGVTWSHTTTRGFAGRILPPGFIFNVEAPTFYTDKESYKFILGYLNTKITNTIFSYINSTMHFLAGDMNKLPIKLDMDKNIKNNVENIVEKNIKISKFDWNSIETSWNFKTHPLIEFINLEQISDFNRIQVLNKNTTIKNSYENMKKYFNEQFEELKKNEEKLNKIFIDALNLQDELAPKEFEKDVTIHKIYDNKEEISEEMKNSQYALTKLDVIKSFISYAIGCMFGRYSLDEDGLIFAGGEFDFNKYNTFEADKDNIIPITDNKYFEDDIVTKFVKFVEIVYGKGTLEENLDFIANTLGKRIAESSRETIRRYFINEFYNDHCNMYTSRGAGKRPIYWLFDSGKKNGFKALIYMHRYNDQTVSKIRLDYLHKMQQTYATELKDVEYKLNNNPTLNEKKELTKKQADLNAKILETNEYDEKVAHIADQRISIDLDDGVAVNYGKFSVKNPKTGKEESILANSKDIVKKTKNSKEE